MNQLRLVLSMDDTNFEIKVSMKSRCPILICELFSLDIFSFSRGGTSSNLPIPLFRTFISIQSYGYNGGDSLASTMRE